MLLDYCVLSKSCSLTWAWLAMVDIVIDCVKPISRLNDGDIRYEKLEICPYACISENKLNVLTDHMLQAGRY